MKYSNFIFYFATTKNNKFDFFFVFNHLRKSLVFLGQYTLSLKQNFWTVSFPQKHRKRKIVWGVKVLAKMLVIKKNFYLYHYYFDLQSFMLLLWSENFQSTGVNVNTKVWPKCNYSKKISFINTSLVFLFRKTYPFGTIPTTQSKSKCFVLSGKW